MRCLLVSTLRLWRPLLSLASTPKSEQHEVVAVRWDSEEGVERNNL